MIITGSNRYHIRHIGNQLRARDIGSITHSTHTHLAITIPTPTVDLAILDQGTGMIKAQTNSGNTT
jgi:hypothetical protein